MNDKRSSQYEQAMKLVIANTIMIIGVWIVSALLLHTAVISGYLTSRHFLRWYSILAGSLSICWIASSILCTIHFLGGMNHDEEKAVRHMAIRLRCAIILRYVGYLIIFAWMIVAIVLF